MMRLDLLVVQQGLARSRQRAQQLIRNGQIQVDGTVCQKSGKLFAETSILTMLGEDLRYVGRGGLKLEFLLEQQQVDLTDCVCLDIGASTGGFTDCMLQHGAKKVYAIDVGHDQLAVSLRQNASVVSMEGTDIRKLERNQIPEEIDFISVDVSFISLEQILPDICRFLSAIKQTKVALLIKPQFEAGRAAIGKHGIVRSSAVHKQVLQSVSTALEQHGLQILCLLPSPIRGGSGNQEYLVLVSPK